MAQTLTLGALGLRTNPNILAEDATGAMVRADNVEIPRPGVIQPRRGLERTNKLGGAVSALGLFADVLLAQFNTNGLRYYDDGANAWNAIPGTHAPIDPRTNRMKFVEAWKNAYVTTSAGVKRIELDANLHTPITPVFAGVPRALDFDFFNCATTGASGFLTDQHAVAYRNVWLFEDQNGKLYTGAPSGRCVIQNTSGSTRNVQLRALIPTMNGTQSTALTGTWYLQVYRSKTSADAVAGVISEPLDDLFLVYEHKALSAADLAAGYVDITDSTPDEALGPGLYTNANGGEGILQSNFPPPYAEQIELFQDCLFFGATATRQRFNLTILAVGGTEGIQANDTITIDGVTYTAKAAPALAGEYQLYDAGGFPGLSVSQQIEFTAISLVSAINKNPANTTVYAYYLSDPDSFPGHILIEQRVAAGLGSFFVGVGGTSKFKCFTPQLSQTTPIESEYDDKPNGLFHSKRGKHEAVPLANEIAGPGSASSKVIALKRLRDSLFVFKEDGLYRLTGSGPGRFAIAEFDPTFRLLARETLVRVANRLVAWGEQGIAEITETGLRYISDPIKDDFQALVDTVGTIDIAQFAFAVGHEADQKVIIYAPSVQADPIAQRGFDCDVAFTFNFQTRAWTRRYDSRELTCGIYRPSQKKFYAGENGSPSGAFGVDSYVFAERRTGTLADFRDVNAVGDAISIACAWEWAPQTGKNPGALKQFSEATVLFGDNQPSSVTFGFYSNLSPTPEEVAIPTATTRDARTYVLPEKQVASRLSFYVEATLNGETFDVLGASLEYRQIGGATTR